MITETIRTWKSAKDQILTAEVPQETRTYKPVSHQELIDLTLERNQMPTIFYCILYIGLYQGLSQKNINLVLKPVYSDTSTL